MNVRKRTPSTDYRTSLHPVNLYKETVKYVSGLGKVEIKVSIVDDEVYLKKKNLMTSHLTKPRVYEGDDRTLKLKIHNVKQSEKPKP